MACLLLFESFYSLPDIIMSDRKSLEVYFEITKAAF